MLRHNDGGYNLEILETDQMMPESNESSVKKEFTENVKKLRTSVIQAERWQCHYRYQKLCSSTTSIQWWDCKMDEKGREGPTCI